MKSSHFPPIFAYEWEKEQENLARRTQSVFSAGNDDVLFSRAFESVTQSIHSRHARNANFEERERKKENIYLQILLSLSVRTRREKIGLIFLARAWLFLLLYLVIKKSSRSEKKTSMRRRGHRYWTSLVEYLYIWLNIINLAPCRRPLFCTSGPQIFSFSFSR